MKIREYNSEGACNKEYNLTSTDNEVRIETSQEIHSTRAAWNKNQTWQRSCQVFYDLFLPVGYPQTVREGYLQYQIYDSIQGLCSYLRGVVSTSAVFQAAGVGDADATAISAAVAWATKDGIAMLGGLLFSYFASKHFDSHVKEFRLFADVINDVGLTLDMLAPVFPRRYLLYITSAATLCKVMCGMAAGATKASITAHFALRGNMADLNAKESTQETLVTLIGMILGIATAKYLHKIDQGDHSSLFSSTWACFLLLTLLHVYANYKGVKLLHLNTLNRERAQNVLRSMVEITALDMCQRFTPGKKRDDGDDHDHITPLITTLLSPQDVNETLWKSARRLLIPSGMIRFGVSFQEMHLDPKHFKWLFGEFQMEHYLLWISSSGHVPVCLRRGSKDEDELKALLHALIIEKFCMKAHKNKMMTYGEEKWTIQRSHVIVNHIFHDIKGLHVDDHPISLMDALAQRGWDCNRFYFSAKPIRLEWDFEKQD